MPCGAISVSSEEVVGSSEPCGVELFHADGADFRRSMRSKILCVPWICVRQNFRHKNKRTYLSSHAKAQSFAKCLRSSATSAYNNFHTEYTEYTEKSLRIGAYLHVFF
jgi:hypothetical protein